jgi:hypothetical protein
MAYELSVTEVPHSSEVSNVVTESHVGGTTTIPTRAGRSQSLASQAPPGQPHTLLTIRRPPPDPVLHMGRTPRALGPAGSIDDASISVASWELSRSGGATIVEVGSGVLDALCGGGGGGCGLWCAVPVVQRFSSCWLGWSHVQGEGRLRGHLCGRGVLRCACDALL